MQQPGFYVATHMCGGDLAGIHLKGQDMISYLKQIDIKKVLPEALWLAGTQFLAALDEVWAFWVALDAALMKIYVANDDLAKKRSQEEWFAGMLSIARQDVEIWKPLQATLEARKRAAERAFLAARAAIRPEQAVALDEVYEEIYREYDELENEWPKRRNEYVERGVVSTEAWAESQEQIQKLTAEIRAARVGIGKKYMSGRAAASKNDPFFLALNAVVFDSEPAGEQRRDS